MTLLPQYNSNKSNNASDYVELTPACNRSKKSLFTELTPFYMFFGVLFFFIGVALFQSNLKNDQSNDYSFGSFFQNVWYSLCAFVLILILGYKIWIVIYTIWCYFQFLGTIFNILGGVVTGVLIFLGTIFFSILGGVVTSVLTLLGIIFFNILWGFLTGH